MMVDNVVVDALKKKFGDAIREVIEFREEITVIVDASRIFEVGEYLRSNSELAYDFLSDICGVDHLPNDPRFEVVYHLYSMKYNRRLRVKTKVSEKNAEIDSLSLIWASANWLERECYDLFGIQFKGHPDLRRILMPEDWEGYPLRKDYPLKGF